MKFTSFKNWLNESTLDDISVEDILSKSYDENVNRYISDITQYSYAYKYENPEMSEMTDEEAAETEDFKKWIEYEMEQRYDDVIDRLYDIPRENGKIRIWRVISVDDKWFEHLKTQGKHLGIYWAFEKNAAEAHWGHNNDNKKLYARIEALVDENKINWLDTVKVNLNFDTGEEEKEIRLFKNTPLKVEQIEINLEEQDISSIKNKTFYA